MEVAKKNTKKEKAEKESRVKEVESKGIIYYIKGEKVYDVEYIIRKGEGREVGEYVNGEIKIRE
jgi:hypothetical protein